MAGKAVGFLEPAALAVVVGEVLVVGVPLGDPGGFVRVVRVPADEIDGVIEIVPVGEASAQDQTDPGRGADQNREEPDHPAVEPTDVLEVGVLEEAGRRNEDVPGERDGREERKSLAIERWRSAVAQAPGWTPGG